MTIGVSSQHAQTPWRVRAERPTDEAAVGELVTAAFGGLEVASLLGALRGDHSWLGLSFVAEHRDAPGRAVGHVSYTRGWVDAPDRLVEVLVLSPLSVAPDVQRRGVGTELVLRSLEALGGRPEPLVFLEGDPAYYRRLGFRPGSELGFLRPSDRIPEPAFQVIALPACPAGLSGRLVYADVFWRHDAVGLRP